MAESKYFLSLCIPSYNRPDGLKRCLESIDVKKHKDVVQVVVCEDQAPKRLEVREVVQTWKESVSYAVKYVENEVNLGHGKNWRQCAHQAEGEFLMYMGDDDMFVPEALDKFIDWLYEHRNLGYVCRAYQILNPDNSIDYFKYYNKDKFFEPGIDAYVAFFMKSNLMSGYTIRREYTYDFEDPSVDYTLFYQMYLMGEVCLRYPSGYCNIPVAQYIGDGVSYFGSSESEKDYYKPGENAATQLSNINKFFVVTELIDKKNNIVSTPLVKLQFSKYSTYPTMLKYRTMSIKELKQCKKTLKSMGLNGSRYFNIYFYALIILGPQICQWMVRKIKQVYGGRPEL